MPGTQVYYRTQFSVSEGAGYLLSRPTRRGIAVAVRKLRIYSDWCPAVPVAGALPQTSIRWLRARGKAHPA